MGFVKEFREFLQEYKVVGLAIAFIMGAAVTALVASLVNDIIMPLAGIMMPGTEWKNTVLTILSAQIKVGSFLAAAINFLIIALVIFAAAKFVLKEERVAKK